MRNEKRAQSSVLGSFALADTRFGELWTGLIASNGVNGTPRTEADPDGSGIQVCMCANRLGIAYQALADPVLRCACSIVLACRPLALGCCVIPL